MHTKLFSSSDGDVHSHIVGKMMPSMPNDTPRGSAVSNIITWIQIMETLTAAASAPLFMRLPQTQLECQGRQVMKGMSVYPVVPEDWTYATCDDPACEHCAFSGMPTPTPKMLLTSACFTNVLSIS